jgi:hypothetical protein
VSATLKIINIEPEFISTYQPSPEPLPAFVAACGNGH